MISRRIIYVWTFRKAFQSIHTYAFTATFRRQINSHVTFPWPLWAYDNNNNDNNTTLIFVRFTTVYFPSTTSTQTYLLFNSDKSQSKSKHSTLRVHWFWPRNRHVILSCVSGHKEPSSIRSMIPNNLSLIIRRGSKGKVKRFLTIDAYHLSCRLNEH